MDRSDYKAGLNAALRLLSRRDHGCAEIARKLLQRGYAPEVVDAALAECCRLDYLDDRKFVIQQVLLLRRKGYGPNRIRSSLYAKGVDGDTISAAMETHCTVQDQLEDCRQAHDRKVGHSQRVSSRSLGKESLYRFLLQRGYPADIVRQVLRENAARPDEYNP
jgi:regulatory protein